MWQEVFFYTGLSFFSSLIFLSLVYYVLRASQRRYGQRFQFGRLLTKIITGRINKPLAAILLFLFVIWVITLIKVLPHATRWMNVHQEAYEAEENEGRWLSGLSSFDSVKDLFKKKATKVSSFLGFKDLSDKNSVWQKFENISIVYTWVNGSELEYRELRKKYGGPNAVGGSRDRDNNELLHSMRSLEKYMPWHKGKIFIVTPGHYPHWLNKSHPRIVLIHQDDIIPDRGYNLPTFSTNAIEPFLHNIQGLTSIFIYMNDDYFFSKRVEPWHLLTIDGSPRFFFESHKVKYTPNHTDPKAIWLGSVYKTNEVLIYAYGANIILNFIKHAPYVYYKAAFEKINHKWHSNIDETIHHRFRNASDVLFPFLHHYYTIHEGSQCCGMTYEIAPPLEMKHEAQFFRIEDNNEKNLQYFEDIKQNIPRFFVLGDSFMKNETSDLIRKFLHERFPEKSSFELH